MGVGVRVWVWVYACLHVSVQEYWNTLTTNWKVSVYHPITSDDQYTRMHTHVRAHTCGRAHSLPLSG